MRFEVEETFFRFARFREWDVSEFSLAKYCALLAGGDDTIDARGGYSSTSTAWRCAAWSGSRAAADTNAPRYPVPWGLANVQRAQKIFGGDFWPYGIEANRATLDAFLGFADHPTYLIIGAIQCIDYDRIGMIDVWAASPTPRRGHCLLSVVRSGGANVRDTY